MYDELSCSDTDNALHPSPTQEWLEQVNKYQNWAIACRRRAEGLAGWGGAWWTHSTACCARTALHELLGTWAPEVLVEVSHCGVQLCSSAAGFSQINSAGGPASVGCRTAMELSVRAGLLGTQHCCYVHAGWSWCRVVPAPGVYMVYALITVLLQLLAECRPAPRSMRTSTACWPRLSG